MCIRDRDRATVTAPAKAAPEKKGTYGCYGNVKLSDTDLSKLKACLLYTSRCV